MHNLGIYRHLESTDQYWNLGVSVETINLVCIELHLVLQFISIFNLATLNEKLNLNPETEKLHKNNEKPPSRFVIYSITDKFCVSFFVRV